MKWYYISRISVFTLVVSIIFFICNISMDIPFTRTFEGNVMHYEVNKIDSIQYANGLGLVYHIDITCITPTGKIKTFENYELEPTGDGKWQCNKVINENKFYTNNVLMYTFWVSLFICSLIIFIMICVIDGWDDPNVLFDDSDKSSKRKCRNLRAKHIIAIENFLGLSKEDQEKSYLLKKLIKCLKNVLRICNM